MKRDEVGELRVDRLNSLELPVLLRLLALLECSTE